MTGSYPRVSTFKSPQDFRARLSQLGLELPCDDRVLSQDASPLAAPLDWNGLRVGNRWAIHPMEGWDGTAEGAPSDLTFRRWRNFGLSGAKLIWGGEAVAVRHDGRANPRQLLIGTERLAEFDRLRQTLLSAHRETGAETDDLLLGLQLTHSGRYSKPNDDSRPEPRILYRHPVLDKRVGVDSDKSIFSDNEIEDLIGDFVRAAVLARKAGFQFVDVKHCHGYLGHEFLTAKTRPGRYGGSFENRTRFLREIVAGIRREAPGLEIGVRLSAFDFCPYKPDPNLTLGAKLGPGIPDRPEGGYPFSFGSPPEDPTSPDFTEGIEFVRLLLSLDIRLINISAGSPYYNPHIQRPALFPPSDGYQPPEDPLVGVARLLSAARAVKAACPEAIVVGTGFTYLQEYLPHVAQAVLREGWMDFVGVGRLVLSYPELPRDTLSGKGLDRKRICRTFSDCTTGPRKGLVSGCYPLDPYYRDSDLARELKVLKGIAK